MKGSLKKAASAVEVTVTIIVSAICLHLIRLCKMVLRTVTVQRSHNLIFAFTFCSHKKNLKCFVDAVSYLHHLLLIEEKCSSSESDLRASY